MARHKERREGAHTSGSSGTGKVSNRHMKDILVGQAKRMEKRYCRKRQTRQ